MVRRGNVTSNRPRINIGLALVYLVKADLLLVVGDIFLDNDASMVTSSIWKPDILVLWIQYVIGTRRGRVYVCS
jgi:hypothetical protein